MVVTDPIADMLTRIRNALTARHELVEVPSSKMKKAIAEILLNEGFVSAVDYTGGTGVQNIKIQLKYGPNKREHVITGLKRISKPGLRVYAGYEDMPKVRNGLGIAVVSTSKGVMTDKQARKEKIGGEILAYVW